MRALGLDVGSKTIGVALTDEAEIAAHPHSVIAREGTARDAATVAALVAKYDVTDLVVGMPFELSGKIGPRAKRVQVLIAALHAALPAIAMHEQDERFTTAEAQRVLIDADLSRQKRKSVIDQQAAALILQAWLDVRQRRG